MHVLKKGFKKNMKRNKNNGSTITIDNQRTKRKFSVCLKLVDINSK